MITEKLFAVMRKDANTVSDSKTLDNLSTETRSFAPSKNFSDQAIATQARYDARIDQLRQLQERFRPYQKM